MTLPVQDLLGLAKSWQSSESPAAGPAGQWLLFWLRPRLKQHSVSLAGFCLRRVGHSGLTTTTAPPAPSGGTTWPGARIGYSVTGPHWQGLILCRLGWFAAMSCTVLAASVGSL